MALVSVPPTSATFLAACTKPEAFTGNPSGVPAVPGIPPATIDQVLRRRADQVAAMIFGDYATLPIIQWDEGVEAAVCALAARTLMGFRGYNRQAGADEEIVKLAEEAQVFVDGAAAGAGGKRYHPLFVDSRSNVPQDSVRVTSYATAQDGLLHRRYDGCNRGCR